MRLADLVRKINPLLTHASSRIGAKIWHAPDVPKDVFVLIFICLFVLGSFLAVQIFDMEQRRKIELRIIQHSGGVGKGGSLPESTIHGMYVGSKTGTVYHLPWCGTVKQIKEENKVWFASKEEAEASGRKPAGNCKGI